MAGYTLTMPIRISEAVAAFQHTPVTQRFSASMRDVSAYIEAEHDLEHSGSWDLSCSHWIRDAEQARAQVLQGLAVLQSIPVEHPFDLPLKRFGVLARLLIESESPQQFQQAFALQDRFPQFFKCDDTGFAARRVNLMIATFRAHLRGLACLSDLTEVVEADYRDLADNEPYELIAPAA